MSIVFQSPSEKRGRFAYLYMDLLAYHGGITIAQMCIVHSGSRWQLAVGNRISYHVLGSMSNRTVSICPSIYLYLSSHLSSHGNYLNPLDGCAVLRGLFVKLNKKQGEVPWQKDLYASCWWRQSNHSLQHQ